jgi:hypothetical protein
MSDASAKLYYTERCGDLLPPERPPKTNMLQSMTTATWKALGLGPACTSGPLPVHSGVYHSLFSAARGAV